MLPFAKYDNSRSGNVSSIFPPLIGSHRKLKIFESPNRQENKKSVSPLRDEQVQAGFLGRMKKARQIILSHEKSKNYYLKRNHRMIDRSKTDNSQKSYTKVVEKSGFSQVVYNIGGKIPQKLNKKRESVDSQRFNDKILRECKSEFMANNSKQSKFLFNIPKRQHTQRSELRHPKVDKFQDQQNCSKSSSKLKIQSSEQKLMEYLFPDEMIKSNGEKLVEKLKKCREQKLNPEIFGQQNKVDEQECKKNQIEDQQQGKLKFPFGQSRNRQKARSKFLCNKKQKKSIKFRFGSEDGKISRDLSSRSISMNQEEKVMDEKMQMSKGDKKQVLMQNSVTFLGKKEQIKLQSKSVHFDQNFKIDGWNSNLKLSTQYQIF